MNEFAAGKVVICRKIAFSSGHRYFRSEWSEEKNRQVFGPLYSSHGFGHNFVLEAYVEGQVDPETGMVVNLKDLDRVLREVTDPLDHHFLNEDVEYFRSKVPSTENITAYCFQELARRIDNDKLRLARVRVYEGDDLWVDCEAR